MSGTRAAALRARLDDALAPTELEIIDESDRHVGHAGAADGKSHFRIEWFSTR